MTLWTCAAHHDFDRFKEDEASRVALSAPEICCVKVWILPFGEFNSFKMSPEHAGETRRVRRIGKDAQADRPDFRLYPLAKLPGGLRQRTELGIATQRTEDMTLTISFTLSKGRPACKRQNCYSDQRQNSKPSLADSVRFPKHGWNTLF